MNDELRTWEDITEEDNEGARARRQGFFGVFEAGGADKEELSRHLASVCPALCQARHYDTPAVLLRGLRLDENRIPEPFKGEHARRGLPLGSAWEALRTAGISSDPKAMVTALEEVDDNYRHEFENVPF